MPVNHSDLNFSFSVVPQTNVIVSSEHPKGTSQEDTPLENLLSKWVAHIHIVFQVSTEVRNVQILPNTASHKQCWGRYWKTQACKLVMFRQKLLFWIQNRSPMCRSVRLQSGLNALVMLVITPVNESSVIGWCQFFYPTISHKCPLQCSPTDALWGKGVCCWDELLNV